ncbi:MAG: hypothetical protein DF168_02198 [Candidatus Moanabacter tarae]|uniref:Uncharacterized protein n=1 Tax=Candidatus Moanibacter tarae TaxID=2200854 RepID=A0A2Z4AF35_9BACT|nr:MAG: hypothetical protein DF168_02198 [Candidatus Moanabacter tarae]|tara:strand:- start:6569 stop:7231 length:663 start_codon:yes stop_codon:yes gene_type:complete
MTIAITATQVHQLNDWGWTVLENLLVDEELERISSAMDEVANHLRQEKGVESKESVSCRNGLVRHEAFLALLDHPKILPLVVDALGWNIQNRDSIFDYAAPLQEGSDPKKLKLGWHFVYEEEFAGTTVDRVMPLLDFKVGWYISDHAEPGHNGNPLGSEPTSRPESQYWFTEDWDSVPLKAWAEDQAGDGPHGWGLGYGATFSKGPDFEFTQLKVPEKKV